MEQQFKHTQIQRGGSSTSLVFQDPFFNHIWKSRRQIYLFKHTKMNGSAMCDFNNNEIYSYLMHEGFHKLHTPYLDIHDCV